MVGVMSFPRTTIGKKVIMAVTGLIWIGFVAGHMFGNLKMYLGAEHFNAYAEGLRTFGEPFLAYGQALWLVRIIIILAVVLHIWAAVTLKMRNLQARPVRYSKHRKLHADAASLSMIYGGVAILLFVLYHLAHFTWGLSAVHPDFRPTDPYHNVIVGFQNRLATGIYLIGLVALALHLYHGTWSMFQTVGLNNKSYDKLLRGLAWLVAIIIPLGFVTVPLGVILGILS
ncbi:MAG: succinate dehydrogenase [Chloroflexi bacterium]|nr:MAG: succinate dehydrogenase [Chloroflexota bacterium]